MKQKTVTISKKQVKTNNKKTNLNDEVDWELVEQIRKSLEEIKQGKAIRVR